MKTIILFALLVLAASCQKEQVNQTKRRLIPEIPILNPCVELDMTKFIGEWRYVSIQNRNDQFPQVIGEGIFQKIVISKDNAKFKDFPVLAFPWFHLDCSIVRGISQEEDVLVSFFGSDLMTFEGKTSGTIWTLKR